MLCTPPLPEPRSLWLLLADSTAPNGFVKIERGCLSAKPPKKKRKGVSHCMAVRQEGSCKAAQFKLVRAWHLRNALTTPALQRIAICFGFKWCTANGAMGNANVQVLGAEDDDELMAWMAKLSQFESGM